jgi:type VI secretion system secreted protein Hcp
MSVARTGFDLRARARVLGLVVAFMLSTIAAASSVTESGKGTLLIPGHKAIEIVSVQHEILVPVDNSSGRSARRRRHHPVVITREVDSSSPQIFEALQEGQVYPIMRLDFSGSKHYSVTLTNAVVTRSRLAGRPSSGAGERRESYSISYQKIEWSWIDGGITQQDSWSMRN